jgi:hypothetical protein
VASLLTPCSGALIWCVSGFWGLSVIVFGAMRIAAVLSARFIRLKNKENSGSGTRSANYRADL